MIYTDIFEAIRAFSPQDIVLSIKDRAGRERDRVDQQDADPYGYDGR